MTYADVDDGCTITCTTTYRSPSALLMHSHRRAMVQPLAGHVASLRILVCSHMIVKQRVTSRCLRTAPLVRSHAVCLPTDGGGGWQTGRGAPAWRWLVVRALQVVRENLGGAQERCCVLGGGVLSEGTKGCGVQPVCRPPREWNHRANEEAVESKYVAVGSQGRLS